MKEPTPQCAVCQDGIDIDADPDSLVQAPDYMPEDFRSRTKVLMCEPCRASQLDKQLEAS